MIALALTALSFTAPASSHYSASLRSRAVPTPQLSCDTSLRVPIAACALATVLACTTPALAVSGGGKDFSGTSLEGQDLSGQKLSGKEFRGSRCANANFAKAALRSSSFYQADLSNVNFDGADLTGASLEEAGLDGSSFRDSVMVSSYLTRTILDAKDIKGADFSEAIMPEKTAKALCSRADATGTNPTTGVETRESLFCP